MVEVGGGKVVEEEGYGEVRDDVREGTDKGTLETVGRDGFFEVSDGERWFFVRGSFEMGFLVGFGFRNRDATSCSHFVVQGLLIWQYFNLNRSAIEP